VPFTIVAFAIAGLAWYLSGDPRRFAEVLVVATPCPLLLAAPIAFIGGVGRAAKSGIVVKSGTTLEQLSRVKSVAFDKTGTLTHGIPEVVGLEPADGFGAQDLLSLAASVEQYSGHVLAAALLEYAKARSGVVIRPAEQATEVTASGMTAVVDGQVVAVGKRAWIASLGADVRSEPPQFGEMAVYVAVDRSYRGQIRFADRVRTNTGEVVSALSRLGVRRIMMLTGDLAATAEHIATGVGIKEVRAECLPADKVAAVRAVETRPLMMVGDGVNDAPVLAAADIGVAMGARGSTAATESADVVIMVDDLFRVVRAVVIGRRTTTVALQSIWLGMTLSIGLMIVACFGLLPAVIGAALQEVVDLVTILFALRGRSPGPGDREAPARSDSQGAEAFRPA
jgi:heavy metal translocating P-type ATPase